MFFYFSSINNAGGTRVEADLFQSIPLQRAGNKTEMAHCALFLASRTSSYVTGAILVADGGSWLTSANDVSMLLGIASSKSAKLWTGALKCISPDPGVLEEAQDKIHEWSCLLSVCLFPTLTCIKPLVFFSLSGYWSSEKKRDKWVLKRRTNCCSITSCCLKLHTKSAFLCYLCWQPAELFKLCKKSGIINFSLIAYSHILLTCSKKKGAVHFP